MKTETAAHTPIADKPYRNIDLTSDRLRRLPMWARLEIARADAKLCRTLTALEDAKTQLEGVALRLEIEAKERAFAGEDNVFMLSAMRGDIARRITDAQSAISAARA